MTRTKFLTTIAAVAVVTATPAIAKPGSGGGNAGAGAGGPAAGGPMSGAGGGISDMGSTMRDLGRANSQGPANADTRAIDRANENSVLRSAPTGTENPAMNSASRSKGETGVRANTSTEVRGGANAGVQLTGVTSGMSVVDSSGATIGTVTDVSARGNGSVRNVQVTLTDGQVITLAPSSLSLSGNVLTTSSVTTTANGRINSQGPANASVNGLTHASPNSVLSGAGVTTLTGLTTGLAVNTTSGSNIGTVSGVLTNRAGAVVGIQVSLANGQTITVPATNLSMNGTTVVTTVTPGP